MQTLLSVVGVQYEIWNKPVPTVTPGLICNHQLAAEVLKTIQASDTEA
jgi:hypothetical protein